MESNQLLEGLGRAVEAAKPAQEYCLRVLDQSWWSCMTKAEWSGWMQAVFSVVAIFASCAVSLILYVKQKNAQRRENERFAEIFAMEWYAYCGAYTFVFSHLKDEAEKSMPMMGLNNLKRWKNVFSDFKIPGDSELAAFAKLDNNLSKNFVKVKVGLENISTALDHCIERSVASKSMKVNVLNLIRLIAGDARDLEVCLDAFLESRGIKTTSSSEVTEIAKKMEQQLNTGG